MLKLKAIKCHKAGQLRRTIESGKSMAYFKVSSIRHLFAELDESAVRVDPIGNFLITIVHSEGLNPKFGPNRPTFQHRLRSQLLNLKLYKTSIRDYIINLYVYVKGLNKFQ